MPGAASVELLKKIIPENELFPPQKRDQLGEPPCLRAWVGDTWLMKDVLKEYFGKPNPLRNWWPRAVAANRGLQMHL